MDWADEEITCNTTTPKRPYWHYHHPWKQNSVWPSDGVQGLPETAKHRETGSDVQDNARAQTRLSVSAALLPELEAVALAAPGLCHVALA